MVARNHFFFIVFLCLTARNVCQKTMACEKSETKTPKIIHDTIIIGGAVASFTAGIYIGRSLRPHILFEGEVFGGQLATTSEVENYPGYSSIDGFELVKRMRTQAIEQGCNVVSEKVVQLELFFDGPGYLFEVVTSEGNRHVAKTVILATGAEAKRLHLPSEEKFWTNGVSACAVCDGSLKRFRDQPIAVVGGGDSGCEEAGFLSRYGSQVFLIHRSEKFRASPIMLNRVKANPKITILTNYVVDDCDGDDSEDGLGLTSILLTHTVTKEKRRLEVRGLFYGIGHKPASNLITDSKSLAGKVVLDVDGYVVTEPRTTMTSLPGLFSSGDLSDRRYRQAITAAGTGCAAAIDIDHYLSDGTGPICSVIVMPEDDRR